MKLVLNDSNTSFSDAGNKGQNATLLTSAIPVPTAEGDYAALLDEHGIAYEASEYYLQVGQPSVGQGWLLHLTAIPTQMPDLLDVVLPLLVASGLPYKIIRNRELHRNLNGGDFGQYKIGKAITIFLDNDTAIGPLMQGLLEKTCDFKGPQVFSDFSLGGIIFTRYGAFITRVETDGFGNKVRVIAGSNGDLVLDRYYTPPIVPAGIDNPFLPFIPERPPQPRFWLVGNKYLPARVLKRDNKGNVWKALYFDKYYMPRWCVVKQARHGMFSDDYGRDIRDRLDWQYNLVKILGKRIPTPQMIDYLKTQDSDYMVMDYIRGGKSLKHVMVDALKDKPWVIQPATVREKVLGYFLQVVAATEKLHALGFAHRDITEHNFMLDNKGSVQLIDLELAYSLSENLPDPPFGLGTPGYMSPAQANEQHPVKQDDIYSLGAMLLMMVTSGISPRYIKEDNRSAFKRKLLFFSGNERLTALIIACLDDDPNARPELTMIRNAIVEYRQALSNIQVVMDPMPQGWQRSAETKTLAQFIHTLAEEKTLAEDQLWFSKVENEYGRDVYPLDNKDFFGGLYRGIGGVIYLLSRLQAAGYNIDELKPRIARNLDFFGTDIAPYLDKMAPSLYYGKAGMAVLVAKAIQAQFMDDTPVNRSFVLKCFDIPASEYDLIYGIAGQAVAMMECESLIEPSIFRELLGQYIGMLCETQQKDGSWRKMDPQFGKEVKVPGLGYGIAGAIYLLLRYSQRSEDRTVWKNIELGLDYLLKTAKRKEGYYYWPNSDLDKNAAAWWCAGSPGIALTFLKAHELSGDKSYLAVAEKSLDVHPEYPVYKFTCQCHGISGLGEIYLEAYRVTNNVKWLRRAEWIGQLLLNLATHPDDRSVLWPAEDGSFPTADFMTGNGGIAHFLLRLNHPGMFEFPIVS